MTDAVKLTKALKGRWHGRYGMACCPAHEDKNPSLQISDDPNKSDGIAVWCHAGCDWKAVKDELRRRGLLNGHAHEGPSKSNGAKRLVATHDYVDKHGKLLYQKLRYEPKEPDGFALRRPDGNGGWIAGLGEVQQVLYNLPAVDEAISLEQPFFLCEGEKGADAVTGIGAVATSCGGANNWRTSYGEDLRDGHVIITPDNDKSGDHLIEQVGRDLVGVAASVKVLALPGLPEGGDAHDWIQAGGTAEKLWKLVETEAREWKPKAEQNSKTAGSMLVYRCASEVDLEPIVWLWPGRIAKGKHTCIAGDPGTGKSQVAIAIIAAITRGGEWPCGEGHAPQGGVILLSAEDGTGDTILPRLHAAGADCGRVYVVDAVREQNGDERTFSLKSDIAVLEKMIDEIGDVVLVVIDTINSYLGKTDSHKNAEVRQVLDPLSKMAERKGVAVVSITHFSKGGSNTATKALHRFLGSIAFVGAPRAAFATFEDPDDPDRRLFLHAKNNLAPRPQGMAYRLEQTIVGQPRKGIVTSRVKWEPNHVTTTADEALAADASSGSDKSAPREGARDFLQQIG